ncbi:lipopolysaccharide biosynthesis protein [Stutzerimonas kunmingensis]|uniref:lipopolysaccharide biosynthesis protein n=1 Tax=Stutzerimonas kunmingensis TaxID=1211807 RepID=UPI00241EC838|nr:oligosaccharide flippase family protein [Stutzerimonas kunmingensis]
MKYLKGLTKSRFVRNVAIVATGTAGAQVITIAFSPIITRLYGPEAFGLLGIFMALLAILTPVAALTYPIAIVLPQEDAEAKAIAKLSFRVALGMAIVTVMLLLIGGEGLLGLLSSESIAPYILLIPLSMFFSACGQIAQQWLIRKQQFSITAKIAVLQAFILNSAKTGIGWFHPDGAVLVILATVGQALDALMLWLGINRSRELSENRKHERVGLTELAKKYKEFPVYRAPQELTNAISRGLPVLMLASLFGPAVAGYYVLGKKMLDVPSQLIGKSVKDVFYPKVAEAKKNKFPLRIMLWKVSGALLVVSIIPYGIVVCFGPEIFSFVFGEKWHTAGSYAVWIAVYSLAALACRPIVAAVPVVRLQRYYFFHELIFLSIRVVALLLGYFFLQSALSSVAAYSLASLLSYVVLFFVVTSKAS